MARTWQEGTTVLIVEDDSLTSLLLTARLKLEGLRVLTASNGREALALLKSERIDLVSTDLMMPVMDGYRLIREIRELPHPVGKVPVLVLSVNQNEEDMVRCLAAGADDYMTKPMSPQVFVEKLWRIWLRSREAQRRPE
jgi:two-component system KDP operon response regulator KdpE